MQGGWPSIARIALFCSRPRRSSWLRRTGKDSQGAQAREESVTAIDDVRDDNSLEKETPCRSGQGGGGARRSAPILSGLADGLLLI